MHLEKSFEGDLQTALMNDAEKTMANLMDNFVELVHTRLRSYGQRHGYDVAPTIASASRVRVDQQSGTITAHVGWADDQMTRWEFGVDPFTMPAREPRTADVLSFVWEDPPQWVREEFDRARSTEGQFVSGWWVFLPEVDETEHPGIPESRAIRNSWNGLRRVLET